MFSRLARPKIFATGATDVKVTADLKFLDWRERITCVRRPIFFVPGAIEVKVPAKRSFFGLARAKYMWSSTDFYCAWRDWKFLRLARSKSNCPPTACFCNSEDRSTNGCRPKQKCQLTDFFFRYWRERSSSDRRPKSFCAWHDRKFLRLAPVEAQVSANRLFVVTGSKEAHVTADGIILGTGANEAKMTADGNFCAWRDRKFLCLARPKQNIPLAAFFCNWGDQKFFEQSSPPTKNFLRLAWQKLFWLAWPKHKFSPTEVYLRLAWP